MKQYLSEEQLEDELVKLVATDWSLIVAGCNTDRVRMPKEVVPLSQAIETIEEFIAKAEAAGYSRRSMTFYVNACKDDFLLFIYGENGIEEDHRGEERPKNPERAYLVMRDTTHEKYYSIGYRTESYVEFAVRDMEKLLAEFDLEKKRKQVGYENLQMENIYFDVYKNYCIVPYGYLYSYKDGKKFIRPLTEKEKEREKVLEERLKKVLLKVLIDNQSPPKVHAEHEVEADMAELYMLRYRDQIKEKQKEAEEQGIAFYPEMIFFETYDAETGALLKTYRIVDGKIVEDTSDVWESLSFMKKGQ